MAAVDEISKDPSKMSKHKDNKKVSCTEATADASPLLTGTLPYTISLITGPMKLGREGLHSPCFAVLFLALQVQDFYRAMAMFAGGRLEELENKPL